jgi:hypothetical protein
MFLHDISETGILDGQSPNNVHHRRGNGMTSETKKRSASFKSFFRNELLPTLRRLETVRRLRLPFLVLCAVAIVSLIVGNVVVGMAGGGLRLLPYVGGGLAALAAAAALYRYVFLARLAAKYGVETPSSLVEVDRARTLLFSNEVVAKTARFAMPGLHHSQAGMIGQGDFMDSQLTDNYFTRYQGHDLFRMRRGQAHIAFSWLKVEYAPPNREERNKRHRLLFNGWFFKALFPQRFQGETMVHHDVAEASMGWLGRSVQGLTVPHGLELIHLEDAEFEHYFMVHSSRQLDARYILTPSFMRAVVDVRKRVHNPMALSFRFDCMYAAFPATVEYFTRMPTRPFTDPAYTRHLYHAVRGFGGLVDDINRNHRLWFNEVRE